jgi:type IV secretory pathway VirB3-like protein
VYLFYASNIELSSGIQVLLLYIWQYSDSAYLNISYQSTVTSSQIKNYAISRAISYNPEVKAKESNGAMLLS